MSGEAVKDLDVAIRLIEGWCRSYAPFADFGNPSMKQHHAESLAFLARVSPPTNTPEKKNES